MGLLAQFSMLQRFDHVNNKSKPEADLNRTLENLLNTSVFVGLE